MYTFGVKCLWMITDFIHPGRFITYLVRWCMLLDFLLRGRYISWMRLVKEVCAIARWVTHHTPLIFRNTMLLCLCWIRVSICCPAFQIVFSDVAPRDEHLRRGVLADLFLDTSAQNSHTTACDILWDALRYSYAMPSVLLLLPPPLSSTSDTSTESLPLTAVNAELDLTRWTGTPLVTLRGEKMSCRVAASLLAAVGLEEDLVVNSHAGDCLFTLIIWSSCQHIMLYLYTLLFNAP